MACESCKLVVEEALDELKLEPLKVDFGVAEFKKELTDAKKLKLNASLNEVGLEIVESKAGILIEKIKQACYEYIKLQEKVNVSDYLNDKLNKEYNYLSTIFSEVEACTIVHFINLLKIERAKEMILFEDYNFTEIAHQLNYNNLAAFSTQFKKITGFNPSHFKKLRETRRIAIQKLTKQENL
jgi:YesN/AraC family two-component response regulator